MIKYNYQDFLGALDFAMACGAGSAGVFAMKKASSSAIKTAEMFKII